MPEPFTPRRLDAIERAIPGGYPAPWTAEPCFGDEQRDVLRGWLVGYDRSHVRPDLRELCGLVATVPDYGEDLAKFIAAARTAVPEMAAEIRRLYALVDRLCDHDFPSPNPQDAEPAPGDCTRCGTTYAQYDAGMGERLAALLEAGGA